MAQTVAEAAPWAVVGAECWIINRANYTGNPRPYKAIVRRVTKTRVTVENSQGQERQFSVGGYERLTQYPRAGSWTPDDSLVAKDDPDVPRWLERMRRESTILRARRACEAFDQRPNKGNATDAIDALAKLLSAYPDEGEYK